MANTHDTLPYEQRKQKAFETIEASLQPNSGIDSLEVFTSLAYRTETHKLIAQHYGVEQVVLFEDVSVAVPEHQQHQLMALPAYERGILPAVMWAKSGLKTKLIVAAPPMPHEWEYAKNLAGDEIINLEVLYMHPNGELINLVNLNPEEYLNTTKGHKALVDQYEEDLKIVKAGGTSKTGHGRLENGYHSYWQTVSELIKTGDISAEKPTLLLPFQTTDEHLVYAEQNGWVGQGVKMLDSAERYRDKRNFYDAMVEKGEGEIVPIYETVEPHEAEGLETYASRIIDAIDNVSMRSRKPGAYVKLDSGGVSGLGNLSPNAHKEIYDQSKDKNARVNTLIEIMQSKVPEGGKLLLQTAVIEESVEIEHQLVYAEYEFTVSGFAIDGVFCPWTLDRFETVDGEYLSNFQARTALELGLNEEEARELFSTIQRAVSALAESDHPYSNGYAAFDVFRDKSGRWLIHDPNLRRGGRSDLEARIALDPNGTAIFNKQYTIQCSQEYNTSDEAEASKPDTIKFSEDYVKGLQEIWPNARLYSSGFSYYPILKHNKKTGKHYWVMKMKVILDLDILVEMAGRESDKTVVDISDQVIEAHTREILTQQNNDE